MMRCSGRRCGRRFIRWWRRVGRTSDLEAVSGGADEQPSGIISGMPMGGMRGCGSIIFAEPGSGRAAKGGWGEPGGTGMGEDQ